MPLELRIRDAPKQDLSRFGEYVYRIRIENRPEITLEEAWRRRAIVDPRSIAFIEFDLPASVVCPGCAENWQRALYVIELKKLPYQSAAFLIGQAVKFGVLGEGSVPEWAREEKDLIEFDKPPLNLEDK
jgi:hypothetical protein